MDMSRGRRWSEKELVNAVRKSFSYRQVITRLGLIPAGGNYAQIKRYIQEYELSTSHFTGKGWRKNRTFQPSPRVPTNRILVKNSSFQSFKLKQRLFSEGLKLQRCEICGWAETSNDGRLPLELDHINGDSTDNRFVNLRILCPNCHSLQPTHRGRNKKRRGGETGRRATLKMS